jgi:serine protease Do
MNVFDLFSSHSSACAENAPVRASSGLTSRPARRVLGMAAVALATSLALGVSTPATAQPTASGAPVVRELPDFADLAERVAPSVVNIRTTSKVRNGNGNGNGAEGNSPELDEQMREFFRRFGIPMPNQQQPQPRRGAPQPRGGGDDEEQSMPRGVGSGFIVSADGIVLTNAHVVDGADEVTVTLPDKREFKAKLLGADKRTDVAVVKIESTGLPFVKIGDAGRLRVGEWVMAIGSPFGLDNTVTAGIVSAKQRETGDFLPLIQTDVAINPGNSGGPLLNLRGEVVGINSQIYSRSGGFMGISFAIPIDEAMRVADQLRSTGRVVRGRIGVQIGPVSKDVAESIGLGKPTGAFVSAVERGGPADKGGVEAGDIVTKVDGKAIESSTELQRTIAAVKPGNKVMLAVYRNGKPQNVSVTVGEFEPERPTRVAKAPDEAPPSSAPKTSIGASVVDLTEAQRKELKLRQGVRIESVEGAAARAGLREGDIVLSIDNQEVVDAKQFNAAVGKADKGKNIAMLVRRGEQSNFVLVRPR